jgi:PST family polysaccharide transporter
MALKEAVSQRVRRGTVWVSLGYSSTKVLSFASNIILARLLAPTVFGLMGMAAVFTGIVQLMGNIGVGAALIHQQEDVDEYANAAFYMNIAVGVGLAALQVAVAPFAAAFYRTPLVATIMMVTAIGYLIAPLGATHSTLLSKEMQFMKTTLPGIVIAVIGTSFTVLLAYLGFGVWSFVIPGLALAPFGVVVSWKLCPWRPRLKLNFPYWRRIFRYGKHLLGSDLLGYFIHNTDYLLVGRFLGAAALGIYTFGFNLGMFAVNNVTWIVGRVTFPAFSKLQSDPENLKRAFLKTMRFIAILSFPLMFGQFVISPEYISVIYSDKWLPAVGPFRLIVLYGVARSVASPGGQILNAVGRPDIALKWNVALLPILITSLLIGAQYGVVGVAAAIAGVLGIAAWVFLFIVFRFMKWDYTLVWRSIKAPLLSSIIMSGFVYALRGLLVSSGQPRYVVLVSSVVLGIATYLLVMRLFFHEPYNEAAVFFRQILGDVRLAFRGRVEHAEAGWFEG